MNHYPIVEHRELRPFFRRGARRQRRQPLTAGKFALLVYEIDGECVLGDPSLAERADAVSVVDIRRNVRVEVPHRGVTAVFRCTVTDPVAVVQARRRTFAVRDLHRFLAQGMASVRGFEHRLDSGDWHVNATVPGMRVVLTRLHVPSGPISVPHNDDDDDYNEA
jgi:hypothetical protein